MTASRDIYREFIESKSQHESDGGFTPSFIPDWLFGFQKQLVEWATRTGRSAIFADCGLGKTPMQLVWAQNVVEHTNKPVLILTPLAVSYQTCREADKFGMVCVRSERGQIAGDIIASNYERLSHFSPADFGGVVCDESSILKNDEGKIRSQVTDFMRTIPYRLLCTATAAPNDFWELGTSSEALGYLGYSDMLTRFFKQDTVKDMLGWGRTTYRFRGHAEQPFWRWVCSWARACRKPSDLGFDDGGFILPPIDISEQCVENTKARPGMLFAVPARSMREQRVEGRLTLSERCETAARMADEHDGASVIWCNLNPEGDLLAKIAHNAVQVAGSMSIDEKEEKLLAFQRGEIKTLVIKPKIGCFGLNWQHCHNVVMFPTHSFEQWYQSVRRCYRFGQTKTVTVRIVTTEGEASILANLKRKQEQAEAMFSSLVEHMNGSIDIEGAWKFQQQEAIPTWL